MSTTKYIVCPFYCSQTSVAIKCEGDGRRKYEFVCFDTPEQKREHRATFCQSIKNCEKCDTYRRILARYEPPKPQVPRQKLKII